MEGKQMKTNTYVRTPRGELKLVDLSVEEAKRAGYGVHHYFKEFVIMTKNNIGIAVKNEASF